MSSIAKKRDWNVQINDEKKKIEMYKKLKLKCARNEQILEVFVF